MLVFKLVKEEPEPANVGAANTFELYVKLSGAIKLPVALPTSKEFEFIEVNPVPPFDIESIPKLIFEALILVKELADPINDVP